MNERLVIFMFANYFNYDISDMIGNLGMSQRIRFFCFTEMLKDTGLSNERLAKTLNALIIDEYIELANICEDENSVYFDPVFEITDKGVMKYYELYGKWYIPVPEGGDKA